MSNRPKKPSAITLGSPYPPGMALRGMSPKDASVGRRSVRALELVKNSEPTIEWSDYDRISPGIYPAYCREAKIYRDPSYKRWTCLILFNLLSEDLHRTIAKVPMWLNLGSGSRPQAGRRSKFFLERIRATGCPPARGDRLSVTAFARRMATVQVADTKGLAPYSKVLNVLSWDTGSSGHSVSKSHSQGRHQLAIAEPMTYKKRMANFGPSRGRGCEHSSTHQGAGDSAFPVRPPKAFRAEEAADP